MQFHHVIFSVFQRHDVVLEVMPADGALEAYLVASTRGLLDVRQLFPFDRREHVREAISADEVDARELRGGLLCWFLLETHRALLLGRRAMQAHAPHVVRLTRVLPLRRHRRQVVSEQGPW